MRNRYLALAVIALALLPLVNGARLVVERRAFLQQALPADATVVALRELKGRSGIVIHPVLRWSGSDGRAREALSNIGAFPAPQAIGDRVPVRYDPDVDDDVRVDSLTGLWFEPALFLLPGVLTLLIGLLLHRRSTDRSVR